MASYDLVERLTDTFRQIERNLLALRDELSDCRLLTARIFELPEVKKKRRARPVIPDSGRSTSGANRL